MPNFKWKEYALEVMLPTTPAVFMFVSGIIFSWEGVADGAPRLAGWIIMLLGGLGFSGLLFALLYRRHAYIFRASFHVGMSYNWRLIGTPKPPFLLTTGTELLLISCLDTAGWLLGYYEADPVLPRTNRSHWYLSWGLCLGFTLLFWGALVAWLLYLLAHCDCHYDTDGSPLPWSFFRRASALPDAQQAALAVAGHDIYHPNIQHIPNMWSNAFPPTEWQSSTHPPYPNRLYEVPGATMTPQGLGFGWQRPIGCAPPRPSRRGAEL